MFSWTADSPGFQRGIASVWWWRKFGFNFHFETHGYYSLKKYWHSEDVQALLPQQLPIGPVACEALVARRAVKAEMLETSCRLHSSFEISTCRSRLSYHQILRAVTCTQSVLLQKNDSNNISNNYSNNNNSNKKSDLLRSLLSTFHVSRTISITSHTLLHLENINKPTIVGHAQGNGFKWSYEEPSKSSEQFKAILQTIILQG